MPDQDKKIYAYSKEERSLILMAQFINGYAAGWKMTVPEAFKDAIDIKLTNRIVKGKTTQEWTQGRLYNFKEGDVIWNAPTNQELWKDAMPHIIFGVQVVMGNSSGYVSKKIYHCDSDNNKIEIEFYKFHPGFVRFQIIRPDQSHALIEYHEFIECSQEDFIVFLQTGIIKTTSGESINLFK